LHPSMGNLDRLLASLAVQLPPNAPHEALVAALRGAAEALSPEHPLRSHLEANKDVCVARLASQLATNKDTVVNLQKQPPAQPPLSLYSGVAASDGVERCSSLLTAALASAQPAPRAEAALRGLLALLPPHEPLPPAAAKLLPHAAALLRGSAHEGALFWGHFLGLALAGGTPPGAVALAASPSAARHALRLAAPELHSASAVLPVARVGFGNGAFSWTRGDAAAALLAARLLGLKEGEEAAKRELRGLLQVALGAGGVAVQLLAQLAPRKRELGADAAAALVEVVEQIGATQSCTRLTAAARASGLPLGKDEEMDAEAEAAQARGDLFFEDVTGAGRGLEEEHEEEKVTEEVGPARQEVEAEEDASLEVEGSAMGKSAKRGLKRKRKAAKA